jgi:AcrR family transcriptional regulator
MFKAETDTRTRILEAARTVLAERGYDATTMRAISNEAGVAVGLANYHFSSRRQLLAEVIATSREHFLGVLEARLPEGDGPEALRRIHEIAAGLVDLMPGWYALCADLDAQGLRDEELARAAAANKAQGQGDLRRYLGYACERFGVPVPADMDEISAVALAAADGIATRALLDPDFDPVPAHRALERMLVASLAPDAEPLDAEWDREPYAELDPPGDVLRARGRR